MGRFTPRLRLFTEAMLVEGEEGTVEREVAVLSLVFDYEGTPVRASDERDRFLGAEAEHSGVDRDRAGEREAQRLLESFGAVELGCLSSHTAAYDSEADYVVHGDGNVHALCSFTAHAAPRLRELGWHVDVAEDYPYQVVDVESGWFADVVPDRLRGDWFSLELGVEVGGVRVSLLDALLELVRSCPDGTSLDKLLRAPARLRALRVTENRYLTLPVERLHRLLKIILELYRPEQQGEVFFFFFAQAPSVLGLEREFAKESPPLVLRAPAGFVQKASALARSTLDTAPRARTLRAELRPYQSDGVGFLQSLRELGFGGVLADDMGLGKTLQAIAHLVLEKEAKRAAGPSLVVAPTSLVGNWARELERFAPFLRRVIVHGNRRHRAWENVAQADVVVTTYPVLIRDLERFAARSYHVLVLDEAQALKNSRSLAFVAVERLAATQKILLSGTPIENNLDELWSLMHTAVPGLLGERKVFRSQFRHPIERDKNVDRLEVLRQRVGPFILRRLKEQVLDDLPPKTELVRPVELAGAQRDLYESIRIAAHTEVRNAIRARGLEGSTIAIVDALLKLRQVCCDPRLVPVPSARDVEHSAKFEHLLELLDAELEKSRRVLVFSQFTRMLGFIAEALERQRRDYLLLTGMTANRQRVIDAFQSGRAPIFLISLKAGGTGLNLTAADTVIHYDPWWNPAAQDQATDRAHRIGQDKPVFVHQLIVSGSVEQRMLELQSFKRRLAGGILDGDRALVGELSAEQIDDLLAPLEE
jgi:superfamily II DNA or RNA helicase